MKIKAYPRVWVDLKFTEVLSILKQMLNKEKARDTKIVPLLEKEFANYIGVKNAVSFSNCRSALYFSFKALDFKKEDEVIIPAFTFWVDPAVVVLAGLKPVFVDVNFDTLNIDTEKIESVITEKTKLILFPHLNGLVVNMDKIMNIAKKYNIRVIEDCARSCGAFYNDKRVGSFDIGAFSFGYGKSFYGFGGGMVTSNDENFIKKLREIKQKEFIKISVKLFYKSVFKGCLLKFLNNPWFHRFTLFPMARKYQKTKKHFNSWFQIKKNPYKEIPDLFRTNMYDLQARLGLKQLKRIDLTNKIRRKYFDFLKEELKELNNIKTVKKQKQDDHVCVHFSLWIENKNDLQNFLMTKGIDSQDESAEDVTQMEYFKPYVNAEFPNAKELNNKILYVPCHPCLNEKDLLYITSKIKEFCKCKN